MSSPYVPFPRLESSTSQLHHRQDSLRPSDSYSVLHARNRNMSAASLGSRFSLSANRMATLEVYELVYGHDPHLSPADAVERLYETNASTYENPVITASSRQVIADINILTRQLSQLDVPGPLAMFKTLFRMSSSAETHASWFQALRVWSDIEDICDSDSFDGHHMSVVEHTLNILIFPGLHGSSAESIYADLVDSGSAVTVGLGTGQAAHHPQPYLNVPGLRSLYLPSPLHLKLHVLTRLSFNEQGRITRHRDFWDVRDVVGLVPGLTVAQWIGRRVAAQGVSMLSQVASWVFSRKDGGSARDEDCERAMSGRSSLSSSVGDVRLAGVTFRDGSGASANALGLHLDDERGGTRHVGVGRGQSQREYLTPKREGDRAAQAPDVDREDPGT